MTAALAAVPVDAPVPSCPEWDARDLAVHTGLFAGFWAHVLCEGTGRPKVDVPDPPVDGVADWFAAVTRDLVELVRDIDPGTEVWTWSPEDQSAGFVARRAAHELAVHRVDAELAAGTQTPVDATLAADGIDEALMIIDHWQRRDPSRVGWGEGERLHLHATDVEHDWHLALDPDGMRVDDGGASPDLRIDASASDLEMLLYRRPTLGPVTRDGDDTALNAWFRVFHFT